MSSPSVLRNVIQPKTPQAPGTAEEEAGRPSGSDTHLQVLLENAPVALAMFDEQMRYLVANRLWVEEFGLQQVVPLVGRSQYEVFPSLHPGWKQVYERALQGHVVRSEHDAQSSRQGETVTYKWEVRPWRKKENASVGGLIVSCEKHLGLAASEKPLGTLPAKATGSEVLDGTVFDAQIPMLLLDHSGRVQRANVAALNPVLSRGIQEGITPFWIAYGDGRDPAALKTETLAALERLVRPGGPSMEVLAISRGEKGDDAVLSQTGLPSQWMLTRSGGRDSNQILAVAQAGKASSQHSSETGTQQLQEELNRARQEAAVLRDVEAAFAKREARQKAVLDSLACGLVVLNERGLPIHHNDHIAKLLGRGLQAGENVENWLLSACPTEEHKQTVSSIWSNDIWRRQLTRVLSLATADGLLKELEFRPVSLAGGGLLITIHDVTDTCRMEEQLRSTEAKFRTLLNEAPVGVVLIDKSGSIFEANSAAERLMQRSKAELRRLNSENWLTPDSVAKRRETLRQMRDEGRRTAAFEIEVQQPDGAAMPADLRIALVPDAAGEIHTAFHFLLPIESKERTSADATNPAVASIETSSAPEQVAEPESSVSIVWLLQTDGSGRIAQWTAEAMARFGFSAEEAQGQWLHGLFRPSDPTGFYADVQEKVALPDEAFEWTYFGKGGVRGTGRFFAKSGSEGGNSVDLFEERVTQKVGAVPMAQTQAAQADPASMAKRVAPWPAADLDREKLLLSETHHRIKNHLQIISSMLNLQMNSLTDQPARDILRSSQNRVRSIAALHQYLYQLVLEEGSDFAEFARGLADRLRECYAVPEDQVSLSIEISPGLLDHEWMMPLALILNETLSNAFEHAFPSGRRGTVDVRLTFEGGEGQFQVRDNGVGLPFGFDSSATPGLGLKILGVFADQMRGELKLVGEPEAGTQFNLRFPMAHVDN